MECGSCSRFYELPERYVQSVHKSKKLGRSLSNPEQQDRNEAQRKWLLTAMRPLTATELRVRYLCRIGAGLPPHFIWNQSGIKSDSR